MIGKRQLGLILMLLGALLLIGQFFVTFTMPLASLAENREVSVWMFMPLILLFSGLYLFAHKARTPGIENKLARILLTLIASGSVSGAMFLIVLIVVFVFQGIEAVDRFLIYTRWVLVALTVCLFPLVYLRLR